METGILLTLMFLLLVSSSLCTAIRVLNRAADEIQHDSEVLLGCEALIVVIRTGKRGKFHPVAQAPFPRNPASDAGSPGCTAQHKAPEAERIVPRCFRRKNGGQFPTPLPAALHCAIGFTMPE